MNIICCVKYVPDVNAFVYCAETQNLDRKAARQILNHDDLTALCHALDIKKKYPDVNIHVVTMGQKNILKYLEDLLRLGCDFVTLITDKRLAGSDTLVTGNVLSKYLSTLNYDMIFTGTISVDGGTSHVPSQIAENLNIPEMINVTKVKQTLERNSVVVTANDKLQNFDYELELPCLIGFEYLLGSKLPYIPRKNISLDVSDKIKFVSIDDLQLTTKEVGTLGSPTKVSKIWVDNYGARSQKVLSEDEGVDFIYNIMTGKESTSL